VLRVLNTLVTAVRKLRRNLRLRVRNLRDFGNLGADAGLAWPSACLFMTLVV
jgi:hypothetical protein